MLIKYWGWSRADLRSVHRSWEHLIWAPKKHKKGRKRKANLLHKNKKLSYVTLFSKLNRKYYRGKENKNDHNTLISCFRRYLDQKIGTSCPKL